MEDNAEVQEQESQPQEELLQEESQPEEQQPNKELLPQKDNTAAKQILSLNFFHLSILLSNLAIFASILTIALAFGGFVTIIATGLTVVLLFCLLFFLTVVTVGVIYLVSDAGKMWGWFEKISDSGLAITQFIYKILPYVSCVSFAICVVSILALTLLNKEKKVGRIVASSVFAVLTLVIAILSLMGVLFK
ncbi:MAG: hypothetical protein IKR12_02745 [Clostridia bacterium]|nr:hypothetical protein [Clostridia bacterium]